MKTFICILALASVANATLLSSLHGGGGNNGYRGPPPPPPPPPFRPPHVINVFHHSAPAAGPALVPAPVAVPVAVPVAQGYGGHEQVIKVIHESAGLSHGGLAVAGSGLSPAIHHDHGVRIIKVINEHAPLVHSAPLVHQASASQVQVLKVLHEQAPLVHPQPAGW